MDHNVINRIHSLRSVPSTLAISIAGSGASEDQARKIIQEGGNDNKVEEWIVELRSLGFFSGGQAVDGVLMGHDAKDRLPKGTVDAGTLLWTRLLAALEADEADFKHRIVMVDCCIKNNLNFMDHDLPRLSHKTALQHIPFGYDADSFPWNGCKFANMAVLHLISQPDAGSKRDAVRSISRSLGGCQIPSPEEIERTRWPRELPKTLSSAFDKAKETGICTAIHVDVTDVEIMRNPSNGLFQTRPGTFAHCFVITVSPAGVYLFQGYGPRGYTLLQNMRSHSDSQQGSPQKYPLSFNEAEEWMKNFEDLACEAGGKWTESVNTAYKVCFEVDLVRIGSMKIGSQLDLYYQVGTIEFDAGQIEENFALLPKVAQSKYPACKDGRIAKAAMPPAGYKPDGGVPHYYVPRVRRCVRCGNVPDTLKPLQCSKCKVVTYCCRDCQVEDWKVRHSKTCKRLRK